MNNKAFQSIAWPEEGTPRQPHLQFPNEGKLVSVSIPCPGVTARSFLIHAEGQERFFWQRGKEQTIYAGFGIAVAIMAWGEACYKDITRKAAALFAHADLDGNLNQHAGPRLFGGFAFQKDFTPDKTWAVFHPGHFILPHFQFTQHNEDSWLTINAILPDEEDLASARGQLREALNVRYANLLQNSENNVAFETTNNFSRISFPMEYKTWAKKVEEAVFKINEGEIEKVVLARACELRSSKKINILQAVDYLNQNFKDCTRFLFEPRPHHAFYGATPEILAQVNQNKLKTMALAGSIHRGLNSVEDKQLSQMLLNSNKDRHEHNLVVESIRRRLKPISTSIEVSNSPQIYTLSYIHHLFTPIKATLNEAYGVLPLVEILHPTPALGGSPRRPALDFIRNAETIPRGWYAGPIGWIDQKMDGEFAVAIRSAVAQDRRVWLYAGAGIVTDSLPANEWAETNLKFQPMFEALGLDKTKMIPSLEGYL